MSTSRRFIFVTGARAVVALSHPPRREIWVGGPTALALAGEKMVPGALDRYLSSAAWEGDR